MKSEIHAILFDRDKWTKAKARQWLKAHGFKAGKLKDDSLDSYYFRFEQTPANRYHKLIQSAPLRYKNPQKFNLKKAHHIGIRLVCGIIKT